MVPNAKSSVYLQALFQHLARKCFDDLQKYISMILIEIFICYSLQHYMMSVTVTVRIPKELKEEAERHGINISHVLRRALEEELRKRKIKEVEEAAKRAGELFSRIPEEEIVNRIKKARKER
jgi:post-segregation antitoxin (ccd killing protein)